MNDVGGLPGPDYMSYDDSAADYTTMDDFDEANREYNKGKKYVDLFTDPRKLQQKREERERKEAERPGVMVGRQVDALSHQEVYNSICSIKDGTPFCSSVEEFNSFYAQNTPMCDPEKDYCERGVSQRDRERIYSLFIACYGDLQFTKVKESATHHVFMVKLNTNLLTDNKYLVAVVSKEYNTPQICYLSQLKWDSFQTRTMKENYDIVSVNIHKNPIKEFLSPIYASKHGKTNTLYDVESLPIKVMLLHKKGKMYEYEDKGRVDLALETYQTIVTF